MEEESNSHNQEKVDDNSTPAVECEGKPENDDAEENEYPSSTSINDLKDEFSDDDQDYENQVPNDEETSNSVNTSDIEDSTTQLSECQDAEEQIESENEVEGDQDTMDIPESSNSSADIVMNDTKNNLVEGTTSEVADDCQDTVSKLENNIELESQNQGNTSEAIESEQKTVLMNSPCGDENIDEQPVANSPEYSDNFLGFDSTSIEMSSEKTKELIQVLQNKEEELVRKNLSMYVDIESSTKEEVGNPEEFLKQEEDDKIDDSLCDDTMPDSMVSNNQSDYMSTNMNEIQTMAQLMNSRKPHPVHPVLGVPVNIFEEQVPSGSKRVKKKRKFFGDFEESDTDKLARRSSTSRPSEEGTKLLNNISGENKENFITSDRLKTEAVSEGDASSQNKTKRSYTFDISNPLFKEPFKHGWKREICYRNLPEGSKSKPAYVSYYSPQGKRFKTIRQIVDLLPPGSELSTQHFTFSVQRIFNESSEFEILRDAKPKMQDFNDVENMDDSAEMTSLHQSTQLTSSEPSKSMSKKKPTPGKLIIKKPKYLKQTENEDNSFETSLLSSSMPSSTPKIVIKGSSLNSSKLNTSKSKSNSAKKDKKSTSSKKSEKSSKKSSQFLENANHSGWEHTNSFDASSPAISKNSTDSRPACSISCPLALGSVPTLQCTVCLSLYHFECCGFDASLPISSYVCKSCRSRAEVQSKFLLAVSESSSSNVLGHELDATAASSRLPKNTKIVDGVTTWLPSSSNVQLSSRHASLSSIVSRTPETTQTTLLQSVLELDGKRYIIVPKESIVSISPNTNSVVNMYSGYDERQNATVEHLVADSTRTATGHVEATRNYVVNSSDMNSTGVLLVPVMPPANEAYCKQIGSGSSKRKLSDASDVSTTKMMKMDNEWTDHCYRSALTLSNIAQLYSPFILCFKYLTVRDLLRVSMSCKYLNRIASEPILWTTVRLKNSRIRGWEGFARTLRKFGTKKLDMRKMLCPSSADEVNAMWNNFLKVISSVTSLEHIEFSRCHARVVETVARTCPNLAVINAVQLLNGDKLSMESFSNLKHLRELRLKDSSGLNMETCDNELDFQSKEVMQVLSLTNMKNLNSVVVKTIGSLNNLRILELGECNDAIMHELTTSIGKLKNLERLRFEQVTKLDPGFELFKSLRDLPNLKSLELINVEVEVGFSEAIIECKNIENLLIIPLYKIKSALSNRLIMDSLEPLSQTLKIFVWGLTTELIKATNLYATKCFDKSGGGNNDAKDSPSKLPESIPMMKRICEQQEVEVEVDIMSVRKLEKKVTETLPQTRVKVITIPFTSTWRQSLSEFLK